MMLLSGTEQLIEWPLSDKIDDEKERSTAIRKGPACGGVIKFTYRRRDRRLVYQHQVGGG